LPAIMKETPHANTNLLLFFRNLQGHFRTSKRSPLP
jgi:hypothetical protein